MSEQRLADGGIETGEEQSRIKRRGLIAGAAALVAGLAAKAARDATPVAAANGDIIHVGDFLTGTAQTLLLITNNSAPPSGMWTVDNGGQADAIRGRNTSGGTAGTAGVRGEIAPGSLGSGVVGSFGLGSGPPTSSGNGVYGYAAAGGTNGVYGVGPSNGQGVTGVCNGPDLTSFGVYGTSDHGYGGVFSGGGFAGLSATGTGGPGAGSNGVYGFANNPGATQITAGVFGDSATTYGLIGRTTAPFYSGLTAITGTTNVAALAATSTNANAYAAYFTGKTVVEGDFYVVRHGDGTGGGKFAAVAHRNGGYVGVYCTESPEPWFEDVGTGKLTNGQAEVALDPEFAALIHTDDYHVFITPRGDYHAHIAQQTPTGFHVALTTTPGASNGTAIAAGGQTQTFSWRVMGKRKDIAGTRLPKVELPKINIPDEAKMPQHPLRGVKPIAPLGPPSVGAKQP